MVLVVKSLTEKLVITGQFSRKVSQVDRQPRYDPKKNLLKSALNPNQTNKKTKQILDTSIKNNKNYKIYLMLQNLYDNIMINFAKFSNGAKFHDTKYRIAKQNRKKILPGLCSFVS